MERNDTVRVGVIGCGSFGTSILAQAPFAPDIELVAVADQNSDAIRRSLQRADIAEERVARCDTAQAALSAIEAGTLAVVADPLLLMELPLDVIAEATGIPEAGARYAEAAIRSGKHVAMVNKEADVTVGPILKHLADRAGVVYTAVDGDQHGLLMGLVAWARGIGLEVLSGGKSRDREICWDPLAGTLSSGSRTGDVAPEDAWIFRPFAQGEAARSIEARKKLLGGWARIDGWDLIEMAIAANATGLVPDRPDGLHCPTVYTSEIPIALCPTGMGGILRSRGVIDFVTCLRQPHEAGLGGGVFIVVTVANAYSREILGSGVCQNDDGTATLITHPYHLLGIEMMRTVWEAARRGRATGAEEYLPRFDVLMRAARDLDAGTILGGDHDPNIEAFIAPAAPVTEGRGLPVNLGTGNRLLRGVVRGATITREMVEAPTNSVLWTLRAQQDVLFLG